MDLGLDDLKYPVGRFQQVENPDVNDINQWIEAIGELPEKLTAALENTDELRHDWRYRPGGWTARQVVHHIAESHINAFCRLKLALTEPTPVVRPYHEDRWANLIDSRSAPIKSSLLIIDGLHQRWTALLKSMTPDDFKRAFFHPDSMKEIRLDHNTNLYAWHGNHHLAQIVNALSSEGKYNKE